MPSPFKQKLAAGESLVGTWVTFTDPAVMEILANCGLDFLIIDGEHSPIDLGSLRDMLIAGKGSDTALLVRVAWNDPVRLKHALDLGCDGVMVPMINSAAEARQAVAACRYPPQGIRSVGAWRPSNYYLDGDDYLLRANDETIIILQIEHKAAVAAADEILAVPGIDGIYIGPADLAASLGHLANSAHPDVQAAIEQAAAACRAAGVPFGTDASTADEAQALGRLGARIFTTGIDTYFLGAGARAAAQRVRSAFNLAPAPER